MWVMPVVTTTSFRITTMLEALSVHRADTLFAPTSLIHRTACSTRTKEKLRHKVEQGQCYIVFFLLQLFIQHNDIQRCEPAKATPECVSSERSRDPRSAVLPSGKLTLKA